MELLLALLPSTMPVKCAQWEITQVLKAQRIAWLVMLELKVFVMKLPLVSLAKAVVQEHSVIQKLLLTVLLAIVDTSTTCLASHRVLPVLLDISLPRSNR